MNKNKRFQLELRNNWWGRLIKTIYIFSIIITGGISINNGCRGAKAGQCVGNNAFYCIRAYKGKWNGCEIENIITAVISMFLVAIILALLWKLICWIIND